MEEETLKFEKEHLGWTIKKLLEEKENLEESLSNTKSHSSDEYIAAYLTAVNQKKVSDITLSIDRPYFARMDVLENEKQEKLYIGKLSVLDSKTQEPIVVDWRAPISNLYYENEFGKSNYAVNNISIDVEVLLKRQFFINNQTLEKYVDSGETINDTMLQSAISQNADDRLKNIVATIQSNQNKIIRAPIDKPLIVQGVAGSGKTTIALHRIAYLIYNYDKNFKPENFMIIAPNSFFLDYISNILPDLGVENVRQYTYENFAYEILKKKLNIEDCNVKLAKIIENAEEASLIIAESKLKSSLKYKDFLDNYLVEFEKEYLPKNDFILNNVLIMEQKEIENLFFNTYSLYCYDKRINEIKKHVKNNLKAKAQEIIATLERKRRAEINAENDITQAERIGIFDKYDKEIKKIEKKQDKIIDEYFNITKKDGVYYYTEFLEKYILNIDNAVSNKQINYLREDTLNNLRKKVIDFDDLSAILYLHYRIYGLNLKYDLKHVVIDEAQDYGEFQFYVMKLILSSNSMTILGDIAQGIHDYRGTTNWDSFRSTLFPNVNSEYVILQETYRTNKPIMNLANKIIDKLSEDEKKFIVFGNPVIEAHNAVTIQEAKNYDIVVEEIVKLLSYYKEIGFKSFGIIGKDMKECGLIYKKLRGFMADINLISDKDTKYCAGISVLPSYLSKGLEFDAVFITNANRDLYKKNSLDIKLLYVSVTRAMSKLNVFYIGEMSEVLEEK